MAYSYLYLFLKTYLLAHIDEQEALMLNEYHACNRTGKRTTLGLLRDGWNSMFRYFLNNFYDGYRQVRINQC